MTLARNLLFEIDVKARVAVNLRTVTANDGVHKFENVEYAKGVDFGR